MPGIIQTIAPEVLTRPRGVATGLRDMRWLEENIPCRTACPAHTDIPGYLSAVYEGNYDEAYRINLRDNVFPAVLGRVCSRPCEDPCRHGWEGLGESVSICFSKRSSSDFKSTDRMILDPLFLPTGKTVAIIGGGPAGLTAARNLALLGHKCTLYEKHERPGGMMNQGIPEFRLPREALDREIDQVRLQGVEIICNSPIGPELPLEKLLNDYDAVVMACGTLRPNILGLEGKENEGIEHGLPWLLAANEFHNATIGDKCLVIGGGFTAMDCARTAFRLQSERMSIDQTDVRVCYRRSEHEMLVTPGEVEELAHESIPMEFMVGPVRYTGEGGQIRGTEFIRNEMGEPDESGRRRPMAVKGSEFIHESDSVLLATGQFPDCAWIDSILYGTIVQDDGWLVNSGGYTTEIDNLFVAGDFSTGAATLIDAIGHAKETALLIDKFLTGEERLVEAVLIEDGRPTPRERSMDFIEQKPMPTIPIDDRTFDAEVEKGFDQDLSKDETSRCYFCHYKYEIDNSRCIKCDQCIQVMPRPECIVRVTSVDTDDEGRVTGYEQADGINYDAEYFINQQDCIRCNACLEVCPTECISVQKVTGCTIAVDSVREGEAYL